MNLKGEGREESTFRVATLVGFENDVNKSIIHLLSLFIDALVSRVICQELGALIRYHYLQHILHREIIGIPCVEMHQGNVS